MLDWFRWIKRRLARFRRLPARARAYLIEAAVYLLLARLARKLLSFQQLTRLFERPAKRPEVEGAGREQLRKEVQWAIDEACWFLPSALTCIPRALAAQMMLRRRQISATLYYGAATLPERGLTAHVWLQDGAEGIVGHQTARDYHILARYPETNPM
jgi:Transglutaminase-like superfamily